MSTAAQHGRPPRLSACIISFQEEDRIAACLESVAFCDEIVVVDSHSTDRTREIAAAAGARVIERDWPGHVAQKQFCIDSAEHDMILAIDCDERVTPRLAAEIEQLRADGFRGHDAWSMPRMTAYLGRWIRHGGWYPDRQTRVFDRRLGRFGGNDPHDHFITRGTTGRLSGDLLHESFRSFEGHLATVENYTTIMARGMHERGKRASCLDLITHPFARFFRFYLLKAGFRDGWRGLLIALIAAQYAFLKYAKLMVLERETPLEDPPG